jgi:hypothetical protein
MKQAVVAWTLALALVAGAAAPGPSEAAGGNRGAAGGASQSILPPANVAVTEMEGTVMEVGPKSLVLNENTIQWDATLTQFLDQRGSPLRGSGLQTGSEVRVQAAETTSGYVALSVRVMSSR